MKCVDLTNGYSAIVDDADYEHVSKHKWFSMIRRRADGTERVYAARNAKLADGRRTTQYMHNVLAGTQKGMCTDHVDGNGLNNRRSNLRVCTQTENARNTCPRKGSSKYKGVYWSSDKNRWRAQIRVRGKSFYIGCFTNETDAARAYDAAAMKLHGEFARLNLQ